MAAHALDQSNIAELRNVYKREPISGAVILNDLSLKVMQSEVLLITGQSGSGKSTALRMLAGIERPDAGSALVLGHNLATMPTRRLNKLKRDHLGIGYQSHNLDTNLTVMDNLIGFAEASGQYDGRTAERADYILTRLGLADRAGQKAATLSGGEKMRIAIGRVLVPGPELLLLDEPTGAIDPAGKAVVFDFLREMQEKDGSTIVMVSHDEQAQDYATRRLEILSGTVVGEEVLSA